jgi:hypothetical protein
MPCKPLAARSCIQNLPKREKKTKEIYLGKFIFNNASESQSPEPFLPQAAVVVEPDTSDDNCVPTIPNEDRFDSGSSESEGFSVEIIDSGSDVETCETELEHFSRILRDAQKVALEEEKKKGKKRKTYTGASRTTLYRRKRFWDDLAAKGFLPIDEFMKQIQGQSGQNNKTRITLAEESEESSDESDGIEIKKFRPDASKSPNAAISGGAHQLTRGLADIAVGEGHRQLRLNTSALASYPDPYSRVFQIWKSNSDPHK